MEITIEISQSDVLKEVAQATAYTGDKMEGDAEAYGRISTVDENEDELKRFWDECRAEITKAFVRMLCSEGMKNDTYWLTLNVSAAFDEALLPGMEIGLFTYFVQGIVARWFVYTNKKEASDYAARAMALLDEVKEKAYYKRKPVRPTYQ